MKVDIFVFEQYHGRIIVSRDSVVGKIARANYSELPEEVMLLANQLRLVISEPEKKYLKWGGYFYVD